MFGREEQGYDSSPYNRNQYTDRVSRVAVLTLLAALTVAEVVEGQLDGDDGVAPLWTARRLSGARSFPGVPQMSF